MPGKSEEAPGEQIHGLPTSIEAALMPSTKNIIITEPNEPFRIVHVNEAWCRSCGFDAEEVLGKTCRIMQGPGTCQATLKMLRQALLLRRHFAVQLLNYSKQGRPFMNTLQVGPLYNPQGQVTHFIGIVLARFLDGGGLVPPSVQQLGSPAIGEKGDGTPPQPALHGEGGLPMKRSFDDREGAVEAHAIHDGELEGEEQAFSPQNEEGGASGVTGQGRVPPFLTKLCEILTAETADIVTISPEAASFTIWDPSRFAKEVLPRYFKHNKLGSFSQQLHTYGFRRRTTSVSLDTSIEFYHEQYTGEPTEFLAWIRAGGAISKRTTTQRPAQVQGSAPPPQLLSDMWQVQEGLKQLAMSFQQVKNAHAIQMRTILTKLTLRGMLTPESASYLAALPPSSPMGPGPGLPPPMPRSTTWDGLSLMAGGHAPSDDNLQAQLDALEAGLLPLSGSHSGGHGSGFGEGNDFQGEEALQMYVDSAPNMGGMGGFGSMGSKELRQQPYPVDVISSQLYNRLGGVPGGGHEHQHR